MSNKMHIEVYRAKQYRDGKPLCFVGDAESDTYFIEYDQRLRDDGDQVRVAHSCGFIVVPYSAVLWVQGWLRADRRQFQWYEYVADGLCRITFHRRHMTINFGNTLIEATKDSVTLGELA